jgi:hypothetical protein
MHTTATSQATLDKSVKFRLVALPETVSEARALAHATLDKWQLWDLVDDATLIVSELVTNSLNALRDDPVLRGEDLLLSIDRERESVSIGVWDPSPKLPTEGPRDLYAVSGRGLPIVAAIADEHGSYPVEEPKGKVVWVRLKI